MRSPTILVFIGLFACKSDEVSSEETGTEVTWSYATNEGPWASFDLVPGSICALAHSGAVDCFGYWDGTEPTGTMRHLGLDTDMACGVAIDGAIECWDGDERFTEGLPDGSAFIDMDVDDFACGLEDTGGVTCWYPDRLSGRAVPDWAEAPPVSDLVSIRISPWMACGLRREGMLACWGDTGLRLHEHELPDVAYADVSTNGVETCAARRDDPGIVCWRGSTGLQEIEGVSAVAVSRADEEKVLCWVDVAGDVGCQEYGAYADENAYLRRAGDHAPASLDFVYVAAHPFGELCALDVEGGIHCWSAGGSWPANLGL